MHLFNKPVPVMWLINQRNALCLMYYSTVVVLIWKSLPLAMCQKII